MTKKTNGHTSPRKPLKTLEVVKDKVFTQMLRLQFREGGRVPDNLSGMYSGHGQAQKAIDDYNEGYNRDKIYPKAPNTKAEKEKPRVVPKPKKATNTKKVETNAKENSEEKDIS